MSPQDGVSRYRRLRAPRRPGTALIEPAAEMIPALVAENGRRALSRAGDLHGKSWAQLATSARRGLLTTARNYTAAYRDVIDPPSRDDRSPILLTGHQPQLFHPGVWFKNFACGRLAERLGGRGVHLLIDNDNLGSAAIRVPTGSASSPAVQYIGLDRSADAIPYEERRVLDADLFKGFGQRVAHAIQPLVKTPLVNQLWPFAVSAMRRTGNLGRALAEARHRLEGEWGLETYEVPLSKLCEAESFHWFVAHILAELPRFLEAYNAALVEYRNLNRIRSRSHPVPQLAREHEWHEAPFWIWSHQDPGRRRLFVRRCGNQLELTDRGGRHFRTTFPGDQGAAAMVNRLAELSAEGIKIRSRALTTTMYARLFLGDLFLHGIGGAKYDELTDSIIQRFFHWEAPAFCVVTATLTLPIERPYVEQEQLRDVERQLREMRFHPERVVIPTEETERIVAEKRRWIASDPPRGERLQRHQEIARANQSLYLRLDDQRSALVARREQLRQLLRHEKLLGLREFSFCLFPEATLRPFLLDF